MKKIIAFVLLFALLLGGCAWQLPGDDIGHLVVHYIDVGQADCMLLIAGETTILIDGGNTDTAGNVVAYLQRYGVEDLDLVVGTHPHGDHIGGLPVVLAHFPVETVWSTTKNYNSQTFDRMVQNAQKQGAQMVVPAPGTVYEADALSVTVLGPLGKSYEDLNDTSLVLMVQFGDKKFLFTGDMEAYAENELVKSHTNLKADVLKVGHHGSYSSTSLAFLEEVDPDYGVISCGRDNEYGHPHGAPMNRLKNADVELLRTDLMGNVVVVTDGKDLGFCLEAGYENAA